METFSPELAAAVAQFGTAGLIAWMWLTERRASGERDRQLSELHQRLLRERECFDATVQVVRDSVKAMVTLEATQRALAEAVDRLAAGLGAPGNAARASAA